MRRPTPAPQPQEMLSPSDALERELSGGGMSCAFDATRRNRPDSGPNTLAHSDSGRRPLERTSAP
jgi:hypothetical protein